VTFKVTPKGVGELEALPTQLMAPYLIVSVLFSVSAIAGERFNSAAGYVFLCILGALTYTCVSVIVPVLHAREMARRVNSSKSTAIRLTSMTALILGILSALPLLYAATHYPAYAEHVFHWSLNSIHLSSLL
jgi:hypothetical protein